MKLFRGMLHNTHCTHQLLPHWNLCQWNSAPSIALFLSTTAITTSTNIHLFYDVFLMQQINCLCCCFACYSLYCYSFFMYFLFYFNFFTVTHKRFHLVYCIVAIVIVCHFVCSLMAFVCQEIKGLLTYSLTSLQNSSKIGLSDAELLMIQDVFALFAFPHCKN